MSVTTGLTAQDQMEKTIISGDTEYLFVYGSLRYQVNHPIREMLNECANFIGSGEVEGELYDLGAYPALYEGGNNTVIGEVYQINNGDKLLPELDDYEGGSANDIKGQEYRRMPLPVKLLNGDIKTAWVYAYMLDLPLHAQHIKCGDYVHYLHRYKKPSGGLGMESSEA